jgi:hypothetical protein
VRSYLRYFVPVLFFGLLACQKEELTDPADYPQLRETTALVQDVSGAVFQARLISPGVGKITDHGFVWWKKNLGEGPVKDLEAVPAGMEKIALGPLNIKASFEATVNYGMAKGAGYFVKSYVTTSDGYTVYGTPTTFMSQGSPLPVVESIQPETVVWGDTVTLTGAHFGYLASTIQVGQTTISEKWKVVASTPTTIRCIVPRTVHENDSKLTVETVGGKTISDISVKIDRSKPVIASISPATGTYGETMTIKGQNFRGDAAYWKVIFQNGNWGSVPVAVSEMTSTEIKVIIPEIDFKEASIRLVRSNQFQDVTSDPAPGLFTMAPPRIQSVAAVPGTNYTQVRISGSGFSKPSVTFAGYMPRIISYNQNEIIIDPIEGVYPRPNSTVQVEITAAQQKDSYSASFDYRAPWIKRSPSQSFPFNSYQGPAATFTINNLGYGVRQASYDEPWQVYRFNSNTYEWQRVSDLPLPRSYDTRTLNSLVINNQAYVVEFTPYTSPAKLTFWKFNPDNTTWTLTRTTTLESNSSRSSSLILCGTADKGYIFDRDKNGSLWELDPAENTWKLVRSNLLPIANSQFAGAFSVAKKIYAILIDNSYYRSPASIYQYDPDNDTWKLQTTFKNDYGCSSYLITNQDNKVYIANAKEVFEYDSASNQVKGVSESPRPYSSPTTRNGFLIQKKYFIYDQNGSMWEAALN